LSPCHLEVKASLERSDVMTFKEYFSDVSLGRLPAGVKMPYDLQYGVTAFASGDNMQLYFKVIKDVQKKVILVNVITREQQYFGS
jgi:hypothetical protein